MIQACLTQIDDQIICTVRHIFVEERLCTFALKYGMTYEQVKEWVKPDEETKALYFCRPGAQPLLLSRPWLFREEFIDIIEGRLLLRGSCSVLVPDERISLALELELPDGSVQDYPCELFRRPDRQKQLFFEAALWSLKSFELSLPFIDAAKVRAFVSIDGIRFDLKWQHLKLSPFVGGVDASYLARKGYIVSKLPDDQGLYLEFWTSLRAQEREHAFLAQVLQQPAAPPLPIVTRIRQAARRMRRLSKKSIWLINDRIPFAGDNGEAFFEYLMANPEARQSVRPIFVLGRDSEDWERVRQIGPTVAYGSILHKILFLAADKFISSMSIAPWTPTVGGGSPFGKDTWIYQDLFDFDYVFLQHGVILHDNSRILHRANREIALFVTSANRERQSIVEGNYGYTADQVVLTGLPRHDKLLHRAAKEKVQQLVVVMPTWRFYLETSRDPQTGLSQPNPTFQKSEYFVFWNTLINHPRLLEALHKYNYRLHFVIHPQATHESDKFQVQEPAVEVLPHCDYQKTFCQAALLLTDYSSVVFDVALLRKPIIYAHFDVEEFFGKHYIKGYFDYERDGFGPICTDLETTVDAVIHYLENDCEMESLYRERMDTFFGLQPENRCRAVVDAIKKLGKRVKNSTDNSSFT